MARPSLLKTVGGWSKRHWPSVLFVLFAVGIWSWITWESAYLRMVTGEGGTDYWEHSATLHALIENPFHPRHPHLAIDAGSPRFGPQFLLVALIARALHENALQAMTLAAALNMLLFLCGIQVFFRSYFRHPLAPLYGLLVMFGAWWHAFHYSNVYELSVLFAVASFPSTTALGLTLLGFALTVRLLRGEVRRTKLWLLVLGVWAAAVFIIHPLTAMMSLSGALLLALAEPTASWRLRFQVALAVVVGCGLSHFWPYFSPWVVLRGGHGRSADWAEQSLQQAADLQVKRRLHLFYQPKGLLMTLGLGCIPLLALPYFLRRRKRWFVALGTLSMLVPFVANMFVEIPLGHRFVLLAIVYLHIGMVALLLRMTPGHSGTFRLLRNRYLGIVSGVLIAALLLFFFGHGVQVAQGRIDQARFLEGRESQLVRDMRNLASIAGDGAVVLASPALSWPVPTFGPKVVVLFHDDPLVPDAVERENSVRRFLGPAASDEERRMILARYGVTHVLLRRERGAPVRFLEKDSTMQAVSRALRLYTLPRSAPTAQP